MLFINCPMIQGRYSLLLFTELKTQNNGTTSGCGKVG